MVTGWRFAVPFLPCRRGRAAHGQSGAQAARARSPIRRPLNRSVKSRIWRLGVIPFLSPAGRGNYSRPQFRLIYVATFRNQGARALYPKDDLFSLHPIEHFFGFGAEWWFNSSSYGG